MIREARRRFDVDTLQHPVAINVRVDDRDYPSILETPRQIERVQVALFGPALYRDLAAARIDADSDTPRKFAAGGLYQIGVAQRGRAENHTGDSGIEPMRDTAMIANAATELHRHRDRADDAAHRNHILGFAGDRAVEIDDMNPGRARRGESTRLRGGIAVEHRRLVHIATQQAHALATFEVDRRIENHGRQLRKLVRRRRPVSWLFSGWNCVPTRLSRPIAAVTGPP